MDDQFNVRINRTGKRNTHDNHPPVRITAETYTRLLVIQHDTGLSFAAILDQIVGYAISHSERWGYLARDVMLEDEPVTVCIEDVLTGKPEPDPEPEPEPDTPKCPFLSGRGKRR